MDAVDEVNEGSSCSFTYSALPEIIVVDLPFFATTIESAYSTLGGEEKVKTLIRDGAKSLSLKFPGQNCLQGSIIGEKMSTGGGLLLRIRRKKANDTSSSLQDLVEQATSIQVLGRVENAYVFNQPADYQFLPETTGLLPITGPQDAHRILETIPRPFCRTQPGMQTDFLFKELSFDHDKYARKKRETGQYHQIKFGDPIPEELNSDATKAWESTARTGTKLKIAEVKVALAQKLKEKPIWKKKQLDLYEPFKSLMYVFFEVLPLLSFGYISGPFKGYIVRYGYDAAKHPESRFLQVLHYRMNKREFHSVKQRISNHVGIQSVGKCIDLDHMIVYDDKKYSIDNPSKGSCVIIFMGIEFKQQQSFQVCDLTDEEMMLFIQKMKRLEVCGKDGWYHLGAITIIRDKFREFVLQRIDEFLSQPRYCNTVSTDSTGRNSGIADCPGNGPMSSEGSSSSSSGSEDLHVRNNIILGERMKYWQDKYLALPDSGIATEADLAAYQNYAELHKKKSGIKSHRLQRIFRMVGKSLCVPKEGKPKLEGSRSSKKRRPLGGGSGSKREETMRRKKRKKFVFEDSGSDDAKDEGEDEEGDDDKTKRVSFAASRRSKQALAKSSQALDSGIQDGSSSSTPYRHRDASVYMDDDNMGSSSSRRGNMTGPAGSGISSAGLGLDAVEAFSFFDDEEEDDDDDESSDSGSDDEDNDNDNEGILDPFGTHENFNFDNDDHPDDDEEYDDDEEEEEDDGNTKIQDPNSAWL